MKKRQILQVLDQIGGKSIFQCADRGDPHKRCSFTFDRAAAAAAATTLAGVRPTDLTGKVIAEAPYYSAVFMSSCYFAAGLPMTARPGYDPAERYVQDEPGWYAWVNARSGTSLIEGNSVWNNHNRTSNASVVDATLPSGPVPRDQIRGGGVMEFLANPQRMLAGAPPKPPAVQEVLAAFDHSSDAYILQAHDVIDPRYGTVDPDRLAPYLGEIAAFKVGDYVFINSSGTGNASASHGMMIVEPGTSSTAALVADWNALGANANPATQQPRPFTDSRKLSFLKNNTYWLFVPAPDSGWVRCDWVYSSSSCADAPFELSSDAPYFVVNG